MPAAWFCVPVLTGGGGGATAAESVAKQFDKIVGTQLKDPTAGTEVKATVDETKATLKDYHAGLEQASADFTMMNEGYAVSAAEFENMDRVLDGARSDAFGRVVTSRAKLRAAIPSAQWDRIVGAAARTKP
jgi:hypothetical protein